MCVLQPEFNCFAKQEPGMIRQKLLTTLFPLPISLKIILPAEDASDAVAPAGVDEARLGEVLRPDEVERPVQEGPQSHRLLLQLREGLKGLILALHCSTFMHLTRAT